MADEEIDNPVEEAPKAPPVWRSKMSSSNDDNVQIEYMGGGTYSILGFTFSSVNRTQSVPSNIANLVIATGKFKKS